METRIETNDITFPASPSENDTHTEGSITYKWDGDKWVGLGHTPSDRLVEGSNNLEINSNNLVWTGNNVGIGTATPDQTLELFKGSGTNLVKVSTASKLYCWYRNREDRINNTNLENC